MELEVTSISERSQDQKGAYVFVHMWSLDFYMHTPRRHARMHSHTHAQIHPRKQRDTHTVLFGKRDQQNGSQERVMSKYE